MESKLDKEDCKSQEFQTFLKEKTKIERLIAASKAQFNKKIDHIYMLVTRWCDGDTNS